MVKNVPTVGQTQSKLLGLKIYPFFKFKFSLTYLLTKNVLPLLAISENCSVKTTEQGAMHGELWTYVE